MPRDCIAVREFDELRKGLKLNSEQKKKFSAFRRRLIKNYKIAGKYSDYYSLTMDGIEPEEANKIVKF